MNNEVRRGWELRVARVRHPRAWLLGLLLGAGCTGEVTIGTGNEGTSTGGIAGANSSSGGQVAQGGHLASGGTAGTVVEEGGTSNDSGGRANPGTGGSPVGSGGKTTGGAPGVGGSLPGKAGAGGEGGRISFEGEPLTSSSKLDLLLVVDNSFGMANKHRPFAEAVDAFLRRMVNPACVSGSERVHREVGAACPQGFARERTPVTDLHVGVISTSLGSHGGDICADPEANDRAHLIPTVRDGVDSYRGFGFAKWDAEQQASPPGLNDEAAFASQVRKMVESTGTTGCGYEAQLESWYRFLVDPEPPLSVEQQSLQTSPVGIDDELLSQRNAFLRPDSAVAVLLLSDENDCSIMDFGQGFLVSTSNLNGASFKMPRSTSICETDPNDVCCLSCAVATVPDGCVSVSKDPACQGGVYTPAAEDNLNLRCWDQKRRFGVDFLYPVERYVDGLTQPAVPNRVGAMVHNPLFLAANGMSRRPELVTFGAVVGVPWQDIADAASLRGPALNFLSASDLDNTGRWRLIGAEPGSRPTDPFMLESVDERSGNNPITNDPIVAGTSLDPSANAINGHESMLKGDDLQFACTFALPDPVNCSGSEPCLCSESDLDENRAACQPPDGGPPGTTQYLDGGRPAIRELQLLRQLGASAVVGSICAKNPGPTNRDYDPDLGYNPALRALEDRLDTVLR